MFIHVYCNMLYIYKCNEYIIMNARTHINIYIYIYIYIYIIILYIIFIYTAFGIIIIYNLRYISLYIVIYNILAKFINI